ncbi:MAG TPA: winged helix-turn-helix domain-containing protein [Candidatus Acidoferrales bacterium]|nr:winged helix-turn-helix domain-containing protein [Candidatus Acidoferrales bacterium]
MATVYRFDDVEVDVGNFRVSKHGKTVALEPKSLTVLVFLIERHGRLVEKRELMDAVWNDASVTENSLTHAITQLRKVLGDDAKKARYIETVPTRGYRFVANLAAVKDESTLIGAPQYSNQARPTSSAKGLASKRSRRLYVLSSALIIVAVLAVTLIFVHRVHSPAEFQILRSSQLTTSTGLSFCPTLAPDGTQMAYSTDSGKGFEIFVRQLIPGGKEVQITSDGGGNVQPAWSPDGNLIVYHSASRGGLWVIPALGGTARKLADFGSHPSWSRDDQWIAFQSSVSDDFGADSSGILPPSAIWVIRPDGTDARQITPPGHPLGAYGAPSWSPDSKHIVFVEDGAAAIWAVALDGSGLVRLTDPSYRSYDPVYSLDGKSVLFGAVEAADGGWLYGLSRVRVSPDTSAPLGKPTQLMSSNGLHIKNLSFSADGKRLVYAAVSLRSSLQALQLSKSTDPVGEPIAITSSFGCRTTLPAFSPNGLLIAFNSCLGKTGEYEQIWSMNADGSNLEQLTPADRPMGFPSWYPDSRHILAGSPDEKKLISIDLTTRERKAVGDWGDNLEDFALSPDGSQLAVNAYVDGARNIWLMIMANGAMRPLTPGKDKFSFPSWSPDGKFIAAEGLRGSDNDVAIITVSSGNIQELTPYHGKEWVQSWSPDGDKVFFAKQDDDLTWNIWSVSRSTKVLEQLTHYTSRNAYVRYPTVSVRNKLVYEYTETNGNIWMVQFK